MLAPAGAALADAPAPSLADTLSYIKEKLDAQGVVYWAAATTDTAANSNFVNQFSFAVTNVQPDAANCKLGSHQTWKRDGQSVIDSDYQTQLGGILDVQVMTMAQATNLDNAKVGHPTYTSETRPDAWELRLVFAGGLLDQFVFLDQSMADRVAKAFAHAAQLCGGLKPDPFG